MKPITNYARSMLAYQAERYTKVVDELPAEALNWQPGRETNSVAQLIRHVYEGLPWLLGMATGVTPTMEQAAVAERHRHTLRNDPETKEELLGIISNAMAEKDDLLAKIDSIDLSEQISPMGRPRQRIFYIGLTVDHAAEHLGHAKLTKQMWEQRG
jgi:uncharacterized damage-inducible protein DinB